MQMQFGQPGCNARRLSQGVVQTPKTRPVVFNAQYIERTWCTMCDFTCIYVLHYKHVAPGQQGEVLGYVQRHTPWDGFGTSSIWHGNQALHACKHKL